MKTIIILALTAEFAMVCNAQETNVSRSVRLSYGHIAGAIENVCIEDFVDYYSGSTIMLDADL